ncbi:histidine kinase [Anaeromassilibacillus sp. An172]|uniref:[Fe-Fe] hydrogenase large subunit C-terminal domain-containing protein n=1 Tax=Anaeromassilibacillus sp. An172 TaxID=1965570 RepID=UPI000B364F99|nr:[Fe-Fe] hydrogenase large subunit C-terminal domain-containing protein [Anaeromassilibacillus sp. An172]OUP78087.1 histidine kinase [Anaeromassilibacillus sp. An172]
MNSCIQFKPSNCRNCYKCIRHCPVKSIRFENNQAHIVHDECILCGECFVVCPQNAKEIRNDVDKVKEVIKSGRPVYASVAPSFVGNYDGANITMFANALKKLGFTDAEETALGANIVKNEYERMIERNDSNVIISSCCHSINTLIQKYYPAALPFLAHVMSPMQAHCKEIKKAHPDAFTVFIGPCISKKDEADKYPEFVDAVLTFEELTGWFNEKEVKIEYCEDQSPKGRSRLFPTTGGILRSMKRNHDICTYISVDGVENCKNAIQDIIDGKVNRCFIEMSACVGSCIGGPAMDKRKSPIGDFMRVDEYAGNDDFVMDIPASEELTKEMKYIGINRQKPGSKAIEEILRKMGKNSPADELNCGSCGYETCRDKAMAVYFGKSDINMCMPYLIEKAESFSDTIIKNTPNAIFVLNESLEIQQMNKTAREMFNIKNIHDVLNEPVVRILDPLPFVNVLNDGVNIRDKKVYLAEYNKYVEQTIILDRSYHIMICFMRDVTEEELQKNKKETMSKNTVDIADKVIEKQMRVVQEIASLLGETTAETKIALTKLKESLNDE